MLETNHLGLHYGLLGCGGVGSGTCVILHGVHYQWIVSSFSDWMQCFCSYTQAYIHLHGQWNVTPLSLYLATFIPPSSSPLCICSSSEPRRTSSWESGKSSRRESELQHICTRASRPTSDSISKLPSEKQEPAAEENEASTVKPPEVLESDWASASSRDLTLYIFFDCWDGRLKFEFRVFLRMRIKKIKLMCSLLGRENEC